MNDKEFLNKLVELCPDGIIGIDRKGVILVFNKAAEKLTGHACEEAIGKLSISEVYHAPELAKEIKKKIYHDDFGGTGRLEGYEVEVGTRDGRKVPIRLSAALLFENGEEIGSVGFFHDLTLKKEMEAKLRKLSVTDSLTGLYNQRHFYGVLEEERARSKRYGRPLGLVCFDLDHFKECNDRLGHLEGDNILRLVGQTLHESLRSTDRAFRYGGDEFMVLLTETDLQRAFDAAERYRRDFNSRWPFESVSLQKASSRVTLSMGVAQLGPDEDAVSFTKRADMAMYEAKRAGGDRTTKAMLQIGVPEHSQSPM